MDIQHHIAPDTFLCDDIVQRRRSALISLSNLSDDRMRLAKSGQWWEDNPQRALANNSAVYNERPDIEIFMEEWLSLIKSKSGERGIFSRQASYNKVKSTGKRDPDHEWGTNPCSEIILRSKQFCNLSEVCIRPTDTLEDLKKKVEIATVLGTLQSTLTDFKYLRKDWKKNCEEERLLGVSLTGIMDHPVLSQPGLVIWDGNKKLREEWLEEMKDVAEKTNKVWADYLGINASTAITCVKPSGTVSQLCDTASGIHPRFSEYYIRRVRQDKKDPLAQFMIEKGFPCEDDVMNPHTYVFSFPMKSPEGSIKVKDVDAISQLETWKVYAEYWCDHKPSITVYVKEDEWLQVGDWVYRNFDKLSGVSFLPYSDHNYRQAPYESIDEDRYNELLSRMPKDVDFSELVEDIDNTVGTKELACVAGVCEI